MKKLFTLAIITIALACVMSCSKAKTSTNYFTFKGATYPISASTRDSAHFRVTFTDPTTAEVGSITCGFDTFAYLTNGQYKVVSGAYTTTLNQMTVLLTIGENTYNATGNDNVSANIALSGGKFTISLPSVRVAGGPLNGAVDSSNLLIHVNE